jgi:DNA-binding response OmpR family regulator
VSVVWIIEKQKGPGRSAAQALMGDFAVRAFASVESFRKLLRVNRRQLPHCVLIDVEDAGLPEASLVDFLGFALGEVPVVLLQQPGGPGERRAALPERFHRCDKPIDGLAFSAFVDGVMRRSRPRGGVVIRYRDLTLDFERFEVVLAAQDDAQSLPLKEAQLLKLFLEHPGQCLSRERIKAALWSGVKVTPRTIDSHVSRLRKRLQEAEVGIESVYGGGYVLR